MSETKGWIWNIEGMRRYNGWLKYGYFSQFSKSVYKYCEYLLEHGKMEDGLSPRLRRRYAAMAWLYRALYQAHQRLDLALAKRVPGYRKNAPPLKLNLGSGRRKAPGFLNVDISPEVEPDLVWNLERKWPWPTSSAVEVRFIHALEHMGSDLKTFVAIMKELYRVSAPGALVVIGAAHPRHDSFVEDPTIMRVITPAAIGLFDATTITRSAGPSLARLAGVDFELIRREVVLDEPYRVQAAEGQISREDAERLVKTSYNVARDFMIELRVHKPPRPLRSPVATDGAAVQPSR